jgi:hypothetical protein
MRRRGRCGLSKSNRKEDDKPGRLIGHKKLGERLSDKEQMKQVFEEEGQRQD